jgi:hypothetical protein
MADENPTGKGAAEPPAPQAEDLRDQAVVLTQVLSNWPTHLRVCDLVREVANDPSDFAERDRVERAVRDLAAAGLLFRCESVVLPTRAAIHFDRLPAQ